MSNQDILFANAELQLSFKSAINPVKIENSKVAERFLRSVWNKDLLTVQEQFYVLYLNTANEAICWRCLHTGAINGSLVDVRLIFGLAFGCLASSLIIAHNHPSGQVIPSKADYKLTDEIVQAGKLLKVAVVDHFILGNDSSYSFMENGYFF